MTDEGVRLFSREYKLAALRRMQAGRTERVGARARDPAQVSLSMARAVSGPGVPRRCAREGGRARRRLWRSWLMAWVAAGCGGGDGRRGAARRADEGAAADRRARAQGRSAAGRARFFSASLAAGQGNAGAERRSWRRGIYAVIQAMTAPLSQGELGVERMCRLAGLSRAGYYRHWQASAPRQEETELRDAIQTLALADRALRLSPDHGPRCAGRAGRSITSGCCA